jgi:hypothetical protein
MDAIPPASDDSSASSSTTTSSIHHHQRQTSGGRSSRTNTSRQSDLTTSLVYQQQQQTAGGSASRSEVTHVRNSQTSAHSSMVVSSGETSQRSSVTYTDWPVQFDEPASSSGGLRPQEYTLTRMHTESRTNNQRTHSNETGISAGSAPRNESFQGGNPPVQSTSTAFAHHLNQRYQGRSDTRATGDSTLNNQQAFTPSLSEPFPSLAHLQNTRGFTTESGPSYTSTTQRGPGLSSSRYLTERKRRISSLASSPEASDGRRQPGLQASDHSRDGNLRVSVGIGNLGSPFAPSQHSIPPESYQNLNRGQRARNTIHMATTSTSAPFPPSGDWRSNSGQRSQQNAEVIDLTGDDDAQTHGRGAQQAQHQSLSSRSSYRDQEILLPIWQPDSDVQNCPVCDKLFTMWYRKHHCR